MDRAGIGASMSSFWVQSTPETNYASLEGDTDVDVAVIGAGITGITAAYLLKEAGKRVALLDMKRVGRGATGYTTGKVTSGHNLIYARLEKGLGLEGARTYAQANETALEKIRELVIALKLDCDLETKANYVYAERKKSVAEIEAEVAAANRAGLAAEFVRETPLPFPVAGAIRLADQAQFHPRKYLLPLVERIEGDGSHVFERTRALDVRRGSPTVVETAAGSVRAHTVLLATHLPFEDQGLLFARAHPHSSYAVAAPIASHVAPDGMFISAHSPTRSVRTAPAGEDVLLIVGGEGHKTGQLADTREPYVRLEQWASERFGIDDFRFRWATHDYVPVDHVPLVGRLVPWGTDVWIATGFGKWGMTNGTAAAMLIADVLTGRQNQLGKVVTPHRRSSFFARPFFSENANVARRFFRDRLRVPGREQLDALEPGDGAIVRVEGETLAVSRSQEGELTALSPRCTHLGCYVAWNRAEETWDCPCHGSRFLPDGSLIQGPAVADLATLDMPAD
jgi:glycine/D-amino acid oxidase-like deaminating enzyme/nitrite reductase/ring-hydroxylating ferredoxin subunit